MTLLDPASLATAFKLTRPIKTGKPGNRRAIAAILFTICLHLPQPGTAASIKVTWDPARVVPGGVVMMKVQAPVALMAAEAAAGADRFPLLKMVDGTYTALIGVDVRSETPTLPVEFSLFPVQGGPPYRIRADLTIRDSRQATPRVQKLSLPTGMVDLNQRRIDQVREDNQTLGEILATRTRERFWREGFMMPVQGRVTTRFGTGRVLNGKPRSSHSGVDIAGRKGTPVKGSNTGTVRLADDFYLSGKTVVVDHGWGVSTIYAHLDRIDVQEGQEIERGQVLGTVGRTGRATGPHLHFGAFIRGAKIDPLQLIEVTRDFNNRSQGS